VQFFQYFAELRVWFTPTLKGSLSGGSMVGFVNLGMDALDG